MSASIFDSKYFGDTFGNPEVQKIFSDEGRFSSWLRFEASLAKTQAKLGLIPESAAAVICSAALYENLDIDCMKREYKKVGFPIVPLIHELAKNCDSDSARYVHWGATTQDAVDTGLSLQMKDAFYIISKQLDELINLVKDLSVKHKKTVMPGRTFQQHAAPITFGFKSSIWLDELLRHKRRLSQVKKHALVCQFGGAVGTLATLEDKGLDVLRELSIDLGLEEPDISWHVSRDGWAEAIFWLALVGASLSKIANEVSTLMRTEIDEIREPFEAGKGSSSTMPQKRNPVACPIIIAIGNKLRESVSSQLSAMTQEHERGVSAMPLEWQVIPEAFILLSGSLNTTISMLSDLQINEKKMLMNLSLGGGMLMAEAVMMGIASKIGRDAAHDLISSVASNAWDKKISLKEALKIDKSVSKYLSGEDIEELTNPSNYLGSSYKMIDRVIDKLKDE